MSYRVRPDLRTDAGWRVDPLRFRRFSAVNDVFNRSWWDPIVRSDKTARFYETYRGPLEDWRNARGFQRRDYALRNAAWHVADIFAELKENEDRREGFLDAFTVLRPASDEREQFDSPAEAAREVKQVALVLGADLVGIAERDDRWIYSEAYSRASDGAKPNDLDPSLHRVIVLGQAMDAALISTAPSALAGAATGLGYSQDVMVLLAIAQYIRNLGYSAVPSLNDTALAIPYAIKAGLGEYGRHGLVITPQFGSNVRFGKIFTDLPLEVDSPIRFGVEEMCTICRACSEACPSSAIPDGTPSDHVHNVSNHVGIEKWSVDGEACFGYWAKINSDCSVCIRVCPYTRDHATWQHKVWSRLASGRFRHVALRWSTRAGHGKRLSSKDWWSGSSQPSRSAPEPTPVAAPTRRQPAAD